MGTNKKLLELHRSQWYNDEKLDRKEFEAHIEKYRQIDALLPHSPFFYGVINMHTYEYEFIGKGQDLVTGYPNDLVCKRGIRFQMENILPEDGEVLLNIGYEKFQEIIVSSDPAEVSKYIFQSNYRFRHADGHYVHLMEQVWVIKVDEDGKPLVGILRVNELPKMQPFRMNVSVRKLLPDQSYEDVYTAGFPESNDCPLSDREKEVLALIAQGHSSKLIAEAMSVSYHTVRTHRRNIMKKLDLTNTGELVGYAFLNNLV